MFEKIFIKALCYTIYSCLGIMALSATTRSVKMTVDTFKGKDEA